MKEKGKSRPKWCTVHGLWWPTLALCQGRLPTVKADTTTGGATPMNHHIPAVGDHRARINVGVTEDLGYIYQYALCIGVLTDKKLPSKKNVGQSVEYYLAYATDGKTNTCHEPVSDHFVYWGALR